jgi:glycosyltransferase involved in cell wall biosynthesis
VRITIVQGAFLPVPALLGGAVEKVWFNLGKEFARRGHEVLHVSRAFKGLPAEETIEGVRHRRVSGFASPARFSQRLVLDFWYSLRAMSRLPHADVVVTNTFWLPALLRGRRKGVPYVHVARYPKGQMKLYRRAILQTVSQPIAEAIIAEDPTARPRVRVIPYPLANAYLLPTLPPASKSVLYTGRVHPEKGVHLLIEAFSRLPAALQKEWSVKIVGPWEIAYGGGGDAYLNKLKEAASSCADRVEFVGRVFDEAKLIGHYRDSSVFVYPSLAEKGETFGLAALEAMAAGCVPIVSGLACFRDFIEPGRNGLVFDHRTPDPARGLRDCLEDVLSARVPVEQLRQAAWNDAKRYTMDSVASQFLTDFAAIRES